MLHANLHETCSIKKVSEKGNLGVFTVEGLYTGYGLTIGNSLRRVLLSSLKGAAITQVKIAGVSHEFSTLPGMVQDIVEFTLNLKKIRLKMTTDEPQTVTLKVKGEKEVTAGDIKTNTFVEVVNKDLKIATLTKKNAELDAELVVERGLGYVPSSELKTGRLAVGTIMLDAIYSPVLRVDSDIEDMRVGERTNYNRVKLEIETDGTITPTEALKKALIILREHFQKMLESEALASAGEFAPAEIKTENEAKSTEPKKKSVKEKKSKK